MIREMRHRIDRTRTQVKEFFGDLRAYRRFQEKTGVVDRELAAVSDWMIGLANDYVQVNPAARLQVGKEVQHGIPLLDDYMQKDPHLASVHETRVLALLSKDYVVEAGGEDPKDIEAAEFLEWNLENMEGTIFEVFESLMDCVAKGFSIAEEVWEYVDEGDWEGKYRLRAIKDKNQKQVRFLTDKFGNLHPERGVQYVDRLGGIVNEFTPEKFIVISYRKRRGNWYGNGLVVDVAWYVMFKRVAMRSWNILLQRFGNPAVVGRYPTNASSSEIDEMKTICKNFAEQMSVTFPDGPEGDRFVLELLESKQEGNVGYERFLQYCDFAISKRYIGATLVSEAGDRGARALGEVHAGIMNLRARFDGLLISDRFTEQTARRVTRFNYPPDVKVPKFFWKFEEPVDVKTIGEGYKIAQELGLDLDKEQVAERLQIRTAEKPEDILRPNTVPFAEGAGVTNLPPLFWRELSRLEQFADIPHIQTITDQLIDAGVMLGVPAMETTRDDLIEKVRKKLVRGKVGPGASRVSVNVAPLRNVLHDTMVMSWLHGADSGVRNLEALGFRFKPRRFEKFEEFADEPREIITAHQSAINTFKGRLPVDRGKFDVMDAQMKMKAFTMAGLTQGTIEQRIQPLLAEAIESGMSFGDVGDRIKEAMLTYTGTVKGTAIKVGQAVDAAHLQTVFRNNVMSAFNQGRMNIFTDPDVKGFVTYGMFSALMDDRTTRICQSWDGRKFKMDNPIWGSITPPLHHDCRSTVIPIPVTDAPDAENSLAGTVAPDKGFGGWALTPKMADIEPVVIETD